MIAVSTAVMLYLAPTAIAAQTCSPSGTPITRTTPDAHYFLYDGNVIALAGLSYEYLCHIALPAPFESQYCSLENHATTLQALHAAGDNIVRLTTIFNSSPGLYQGFSAPFADEEPYVWSGSKWDLSQTDKTFLANLESVVCSAYNLGMIVEVTLLDPWNPNWSQSPFNPANTVTGSQGFTANQYFGSFDNPTANPPTDTNPQNSKARTYQKNGVIAVVNRLKPYPNVIWEIANEPDFAPAGLPVAYVVQWEEQMLKVVQENDSSPPHEIIVNGHTPQSFAWEVAGAGVQSSHYTQIDKSGFEGAIQVMRDSTLVSQRAGIALGFGENQSVPNVSYTWRTADDMRAEAYEFMFDGGGLFNGYSYNMTASSAQTAAAQIGALSTLLNTGGVMLSSMEQSNCDITGSSRSWCQGILAWGSPDTSCLTSPQAKIYWSTMSTASDFWLYLHHGEPMSAVPGGPTIFDGYHELPCGNGSTTGYNTAVQFVLPGESEACYEYFWIDPRTGVAISSEVNAYTGGVLYTVANPPYYTDDVVFRLKPFTGICGFGG
jgi:hypothetical protein